MPTALAARSPASTTAEPARSIGNHLIRVEPRKVDTYITNKQLDNHHNCQYASRNIEMRKDE
ncbi:hypothetical protein CCE29_04195 [Lacticaseibacillus rhamnosus]|nr:hypothetical protein B4583_00625 [Lacticaseibacillus rhamnosus]AXI93581.1 hypothetical protein DU507_03055 [Lacticaseibacillus rhamnosus GG]ART95220.1 hypothetical protein CCE29_04195 [Lacticaseibacillus rhamnosus]AZZ22254.1 hypothetical protein CYG41_03035 [Lacticaseibacillus rhamnosus]PTV10193.1 hypothetical protein DB338_02555 [Lacticaseibacillus rhamnosus]